ncbi:MAG: hypothetical protein MUF72_15430 [Elainella sp. Prado103]|nr:hypothetical protein [Elainella sp. Prado103]
MKNPDRHCPWTQSLLQPHADQTMMSAPIQNARINPEIPQHFGFWL